jgi:hypothetical protein
MASGLRATSRARGSERVWAYVGSDGMKRLSKLLRPGTKDLRMSAVTADSPNLRAEPRSICILPCLMRRRAVILLQPQGTGCLIRPHQGAFGLAQTSAHRVPHAVQKENDRKMCRRKLGRCLVFHGKNPGAIADTGSEPRQGWRDLGNGQAMAESGGTLAGRLVRGR